MVRLYMDVETYRPNSANAFVDEKIILIALLKDESPFTSDSLRRDPEIVTFPVDRLSSENEILKQSLKYVRDMRSQYRFVDVIGFNILRFDIPLIISKAVDSKIDSVANLSKLWNDNFSADHFQLLLPTNNRLFKGLRLDNVVKKAKELELSPKPPDPYGSSKDIKSLYDQGKTDEIVKHCVADLRIVRWLDLYGTRALLRLAVRNDTPMFYN
ncbi:MAG: hypothetical protein JRN52_14845 [Nitrososphaerota archaeon]|nr:hypothetical protein [Nitrososphaerota archaeon]